MHPRISTQEPLDIPLQRTALNRLPPGITKESFNWLETKATLDNVGNNHNV